MDCPVRPLLLIIVRVDDHAAPLEIHESCLLECGFIGSRSPEVIVELGIASLRRKFDVDWVSLLDRRFVCSVDTLILVGFVKVLLLGDKRARINTDESTARLQDIVSALDKLLKHFLGGRIVEQVSGGN